ncbi:NACHT domain-containing protein [Spirulina subsalsa FACHB-351]|uniref:NACHT domain-containing protein n=1 Tax=Spirulina subsalsa FACHB-351 TaxID=234711 RepID=A0ABT3L1Y7_9CYAN|nr:NACHT domain-containing protein [Spirulina subsalsa]MCW6035518.1 NACHT domain-containing protein [Spirulina subsalsa FACHB-351]
MAQPAKQLLKATPDGIQQAKLAWLASANQIMRNLESAPYFISQKTIHHFFEGQPIESQDFQKICIALGLKWREIAGLPQKPRPIPPPPAAPPRVNSSLRAIADSVRERLYTKLQERYSQITLLNHRLAPTSGVEFDVYRVSRVSRETYLDLTEFVNHPHERAEVERLGLGERQDRLGGLQAVQTSPRLILLGPSGAGKTTFLSRVAIACTQGELPEHWIPVYICLHDFPDTTLESPNFLRATIQQILDTEENKQTEYLLNAGQLLILIDGMDEVPLTIRRHLQYQIRSLLQRYYKNRFLLTCRTQITEYTFPTFEYIELAEFNRSQLQKFADVWFTSQNIEKPKSVLKQFLAELDLPKYHKVVPLFNTPLFLSFACWIFQDLNKLPKRPFDFYEQGLDRLLEQWNLVYPRFQSYIYQTLDKAHKLKLLSLLSSLLFQKQELLVEYDVMCQYLYSYVTEVLQIPAHPQELLKESQQILQSIEGQHGLIIEKLPSIMSFGNHGIHEYLTSELILEHFKADDLDAIINPFIKIQWQKYLLFAVNHLENVNDLLMRLKKKIDYLLVNDPKIQIFLSWVNQKSLLVKVPYKPAAVRAFYFSQALARIFEPKLARPLDFSHAVDRVLRSSLHDRTLACELDEKLDQAFRRYPLRNLDYDLLIDLVLDCLLGTFANDLGLFITFMQDRQLKLDPDLRAALNRFKEQIPDATQDRSKYQKWWQANNKIWTRNLRLVIIESRNIGYDWQFSKAQQELLKQYYEANKLLVACLYSNPKISPDVIQEIEDTLILSVAELESRYHDEI